MRRSRAAAVAACVAGLAGCGGDDAERPASPPASTAPAQPAGDSKGLRAFLRSRGRRDGAAWAGAIHRSRTVLRRGGDEGVVVVAGTPSETDLEEVCSAAKDYRTGPAIVKVSRADGSLVTEC